MRKKHFTVGFVFITLLFLTVCNVWAADTIKIGAPDPLTGIYAVDGNVMLNVTKLAVADINEAGGLLGKKLEVVAFDIEDMLPEKLIAAAEVLVAKEKCDLIITACNAMGPDVQAFGKYDVPYICNNASTVATNMVKDNPQQYWNCFQAGDNEPKYVAKTIETFMGFGYQMPNKKIAMVYSEYDWDKKIIEALKQQSKNYGLDIVVYEQVPASTNAWGPILTKIRAHNPALIFLSIYAPESIAAFADQFAQNPTNSLVDLGYAVSIPSFMGIAGRFASGITGYGALGAPPKVTAEGRAVEKRYMKMFKTKDMPFCIGPCVYDGVMAWAAAVKRAGKIDDYRAVSAALKQHPYKGIGGTYDFNNPLQAARQGDNLLPVNFFQAQGGNLVLRNLGSYTMSEYELPPWIKTPWPKAQ
jgi:branched-chain amino acid transport system substrate-binding protein